MGKQVRRRIGRSVDLHASRPIPSHRVRGARCSLVFGLVAPFRPCSLAVACRGGRRCSRWCAVSLPLLVVLASPCRFLSAARGVPRRCCTLSRRCKRSRGLVAPTPLPVRGCRAPVGPVPPGVSRSAALAAAGSWPSVGRGLALAVVVVVRGVSAARASRWPWRRLACAGGACCRFAAAFGVFAAGCVPALGAGLFVDPTRRRFGVRLPPYGVGSCPYLGRAASAGSSSGWCSRLVPASPSRAGGAAAFAGLSAISGEPTAARFVPHGKV